MMDMQRAIEAAAGERFAIETALGPDWVDDLSAAAKGYIKSPGAKMGWNAVVREAQEKVASLKVGGTRRQAEHALAQIRQAVEAGRADLVDQALKWWTYDRQQYALKRIARTEMATAHHRAVIAASQDDPDVTGYLWRLSASHPEPDICDYYADIELGLGQGVWPKDQVPKGKAHPHCMCSLTPTTRKMRKDGARGETDLDGLKARMGEKARAGFEAEQKASAGGAGSAPRDGGPVRDAGATPNKPAPNQAPGASAGKPAPTVAAVAPTAIKAPESEKRVAKAKSDQPTWKDIGLADLRTFQGAEAAPELIPGAVTMQDAYVALRDALGVPEGGHLAITTPVEKVRIEAASLPHVVEKRADQRERFGRFVLPTLSRPSEVWEVAYDDGSVRRRYLKLFAGSKYDLLVMVKVEPDGSVFWNLMQRERKGMNALRIGQRVYADGGT